MPCAASHVAANSPADKALRENEEIYAPGTRHNDDGTMIRYSPALEKRYKAEKLQRKQEVSLMATGNVMKVHGGGRGGACSDCLMARWYGQ